jgi:hypothetical protein
MATKTAKSSGDPINASSSTSKRRKTSTKVKSESIDREVAIVLEKKSLSHKKKLESVRKANQALLKALALMS